MTMDVPYVNFEQLFSHLVKRQQQMSACSMYGLFWVTNLIYAGCIHEVYSEPC